MYRFLGTIPEPTKTGSVRHAFRLPASHSTFEDHEERPSFKRGKMTTPLATTKTTSPATGCPVVAPVPAAGARDASTPATQEADVVEVPASSAARRTRSTNASPPPPAKRAKGKAPLKRSTIMLAEAPSGNSRPYEKATAKPTAPRASKSAPTGSSSDVERLKTIMSQSEVSDRNEIDALNGQLTELKAILLSAPATTPSPAPAPSTSTLASAMSTVQATAARGTTVPNAKGELPPAELSVIRSDLFGDYATRKVKGNYYPPEVHTLAGSRLFKGLATRGKWSSPTDFLLWVREVERVRFSWSPAILQALFSARLGSRGASVMMFVERPEAEVLAAGSSNKNYDMSFGVGANLGVSPACSSYDDLLDAIHGLSSMANDLWYDHARKLLSRVRVFVSKNKSADPKGDPSRVRLTRLYVDKFIGKAMANLQSDSESWWHQYCDDLRSIDYLNPEWSMSLVNCAMEREAAHVQKKPRPDAYRGQAYPVKRPNMPDSIAKLVPKNRYGQEPCRAKCTNGNLQFWLFRVKIALSKGDF